MKQAGELLSLTIEQWRELTDAQLTEWAREVFAVTRPSEKQKNVANFKAILKKSGINPAIFKQPQPWKKRDESYGEAALFDIDKQNVPDVTKQIYKMLPPDKQAEFRKTLSTSSQRI